jgi:hypothetical protein
MWRNGESTVQNGFPMNPYQIHSILKKPVVLEIGELGRLEFPAE